MSQLITVDRATLEQLVESLEEVSDYINRYAVPAHQLELDPIDEAITAGRAALAQQATLVPQEWTNLLAYALQDDMRNRLTPRVVDIAYTAFTLAKRPNSEDGGASDWFNDTKPKVTELIAKLRKDLIEEFAAAPAPQAQQGEPVAQARLGMQDGLAMALSVVELYGMKGDVIYREIAKLRDGIAAAPAPQAQEQSCPECHCHFVGSDVTAPGSTRLVNTAQQAQPAQASGRTNPGDETGGAVERFGWQTFLGKSPEIVPATNGSFVWYSDYLKLWQSAQQAATKNCPQPAFDKALAYALRTAN